jgi:exonuclease VII large subunit
VQAGAFQEADDALPDAEQPAGDFAAQQLAQDTSPRAAADVLVESPASAAEMAATDASDAPTQADRTAATLSKELRKLQAESAVLQEHSRRLQEKAAVMQQQRTSVDQVC